MSDRLIRESPGQERSSRSPGQAGSPSPRRLTLAVSARWDAHPSRFSWIERQGLALEYTPDPEGIHNSRKHTARFIEAGISLRYHGLFPAHDIAHVDAAVSEKAVQRHVALLEVIHAQRGQVVTFHACHVGRDGADEVDPGKAAGSLSRLVGIANHLGITVCVENLARGPSSDPVNVARWARDSGAMITLDIGHVLASQSVKRGEMSALEFVELTADRMMEAHVYGAETDRHHPITNMESLQPILDRLLETGCNWWTIELEDQEELMSTRGLLLDYLDSRGVHMDP